MNNFLNKILITILLFSTLSAIAQDRTWQRLFPSDTAVAKMTRPENGIAKIDDKEFNVSVALQIRNENNLIIFPSMMADSSLVRYQLDSSGNIWRVWILSDSEKKPTISGGKKIPPVLH